MGQGGRFEGCCKEGDIYLLPIQEPPEPLWTLWTGQDPRSQAFRKAVRGYNNALALTSLSYHRDTRVNLRARIQTFQIHGEIFHFQGDLIPGSQETPAFA